MSVSKSFFGYGVNWPKNFSKISSQKLFITYLEPFKLGTSGANFLGGALMPSVPHCAPFLIGFWLLASHLEVEMH